VFLKDREEWQYFAGTKRNFFIFIDYSNLVEFFHTEVTFDCTINMPEMEFFLAEYFYFRVGSGNCLTFFNFNFNGINSKCQIEVLRSFFDIKSENIMITKNSQFIDYNIYNFIIVDVKCALLFENLNFTLFPKIKIFFQLRGGNRLTFLNCQFLDNTPQENKYRFRFINSQGTIDVQIIGTKFNIDKTINSWVLK
jgi:hypothetical protein